MRAPRSNLAARAALVTVLALLAGACATESSSGDRDEPVPGSLPRTEVSVVEVTDGDTIRVILGGAETPVRMIGIDTPEEDGPYTEEDCFGEQASRFAADTLGGRDVELEFDAERLDRFDRTLAYVWLDGSLFNERVLREGYGVLATFPPNVRYVERLTAAERQARGDGAGLWSECPST